MNRVDSESAATGDTLSTDRPLLPTVPTKTPRPRVTVRLIEKIGDRVKVIHGVEREREREQQLMLKCVKPFCAESARSLCADKCIKHEERGRKGKLRNRDLGDLLSVLYRPSVSTELSQQHMSVGLKKGSPRTQAKSSGSEANECKATRQMQCGRMKACV
jgi:hypothetical protein